MGGACEIVSMVTDFGVSAKYHYSPPLFLLVGTNDSVLIKFNCSWN